MNRYEMIYESICDLYNEGILTEEEANEVNDLAYEKYVMEWTDNDPEYKKELIDLIMYRNKSYSKSELEKKPTPTLRRILGCVMKTSEEQDNKNDSLNEFGRKRHINKDY